MFQMPAIILVVGIEGLLVLERICVECGLWRARPEAGVAATFLISLRHAD